ncbi:hypothetical protein N3K66_001445 [Trichothecium roseum]|uniref:Uncharacterized protein n=1 Tax=Trichothecium roseum TaxID=47278 RepID=A0ACC0VEN9_9HYPO|nr:hypothetical protein N3K66_001445 [Trichothecium roseum]
MADATSVPKKKKLPFKPTALNRKKAAPKPTTETAGADGKDEEDDLALFRRSGEMRARLEAEREKAYRKYQRTERRRSSQSEAPKPEPITPSSKRSRDAGSDSVDAEAVTVGERCSSSTPSLSPSRQRPARSLAEKFTAAAEEADDDGYDGGSDVFEASPDPSISRRPSASKTSTPMRTRAAALQQSHGGLTPVSGTDLSHGTPAISLSDSETEDATRPAKRRRNDQAEARDETPEEAAAEEPDEDEDEELAKWVRKAEEDNMDWDDQAAREPVDVLVSTFIDGIGPLGVRVHYTYPMSRVREAWLRRQQHLGPQEKEDVFLTWNGQKVYNTSDLKGLGVRPAHSGRLTTKSGSLKGLSENRTKVLMEMWTPELFRKYTLEAERRRRRLAGEISDDEDDEDEGRHGGGGARGAEPEPEVRLKVTLQARGMKDLGSTVRPGTLVGTLAEYFRAQRGVGPDREVRIMFDGDVLDEEETMEGAEIDDMDVLEVHIR